jgi:hypothetical protein
VQNKNKTANESIKRLKKFDKKLLNSIIIGGAILIIGAIWGIVALSGGGSHETTIVTEKVEKTVTGISTDENRKAALSAATNVLNAAVKSPTKEEFDERLTKLDKGDFSVVSPDLENLMRFKDVFAESKDLKINTYQALITFSTLIQKTTEKETIAPISENEWQKVFVDSEAGIAFVPLSLYAGSSVAFSLEMVYIDNEWKLAPYSVLDAVKLSAMLQAPTSAENTGK